MVKERDKQKKKKEREKRVAQKKLAAQKHAREQASKSDQTKGGKPTISTGVAESVKPAPTTAGARSPFIHRRTGG